MLLTFDKSHIAALLALSKETEAPYPILEQVVSPEFWRDDLAPERRAHLDKQIETDDLAFDARSEDVDPKKLPRGLILVGDRGVYLMSQAPRAEIEGLGVAHVAYASQANPEILNFETWWANKRASFGGDDGTLLLPAEAVEAGLASARDDFAIDLTPETCAIIT